MTLNRGEEQLRIAGIMSFMRAPQGDVEDLEEGMIGIAGVTYDLSCTSRIGARFAPRAIRDTSAYYGGYSPARGGGGDNHRPEDEVPRGRESNRPGRPERLSRRLGPDGSRVCETPCTRSRRTGALPVILGGDHFITYPLVEGFKDAVAGGGDKKIGYIQFSSQLDLGEQDPVWGTCVARGDSPPHTGRRDGGLQEHGLGRHERLHTGRTSGSLRRSST